MRPENLTPNSLLNWKLILCLVLLWAIPEPGISSENLMSSLLDGKRFEGTISSSAKPGLIEEVVQFEKGQFISAECERRCGYARSNYWFRLDNGSIHFKTRINCTLADAWIDWTGTILGDRITGKLKWTSERWYWTTEREFSFDGQLVESSIPQQSNP